MKNFLRNHILQVITFIFWVIIIYSYFHYVYFYNLSNADIAKNVYFFIKKDIVYGWFIYIWVYLLRTIVFVPASLLVILSPSLFWFTYAFIYTMIWENVSAILGYFLWDFFWKAILKWKFLEKIMGMKEKIKKETFITIIISRLLFLPFDAVNYLSWFLKADFKKYFWWTFIWTIPWILMLLFIWISIKNVENFDLNNISINYNYLIYSALLFIVPILFVYIYNKFKKRY
ncbi:MAG: hypothetical protein ACD_4C00270G0003 [uncultured bacterium (gcode 4)]|uniref:TVP38/TMEM64 family membrane protein n=1 Tax=uncultured bacterium (gcode 4) TaxID=1234023 RepID=K2FU76_9BACT|nr:MAG: hypothetical protein ACD_4C00270G0003 [uncultured bacterium (gcode 4)]